MNLDNYIFQLLEQEESFAIEGLGSFVSENETASIHPVSHKFLPPSKKVIFNNELKEADGKLVAVVSNGEQISEEEAKAIVSVYTDEISKKIEDSGFYEIEKVGRLFYNPENKLDFEPFLDNNFLEESFGLPELSNKPIDRNPVVDQPSKKSSVKEKVKEKAEKSEKPAKKRSFAALWALIPLLAILGIGAFLYLNKDNKDMQSKFPLSLLNKPEKAEEPEEAEESSEVIEETPAEVFEANTNTTGRSENESEAPESETEIIAEPEFHEVAVSGKQGKFSIIAGSFVEKQNAENFKLKIEGQGKSALLIPPKGNSRFYRVSVAEFNDENAAKSSLNNYRAEFGNEIWIMSK